MYMEMNIWSTCKLFEACIYFPKASHRLLESLEQLVLLTRLQSLLLRQSQGQKSKHAQKYSSEYVDISNIPFEIISVRRTYVYNHILRNICATSSLKKSLLLWIVKVLFHRKFIVVQSFLYVGKDLQIMQMNFLVQKSQGQDLSLCFKSILPLYLSIFRWLMHARGMGIDDCIQFQTVDPHSYQCLV